MMTVLPRTPDQTPTMVCAAAASGTLTTNVVRTRALPDICSL